MSESSGNEDISTRPYITAVRDILKILSLCRKESEHEGIEWFRFNDPLLEGSEDLYFPIDVDKPGSDDLAVYIIKQMEYIQTFLVSDRLGQYLKDVPPLVPPNLDINKYIARILKVLGRSTGEKRDTDELRYFPFPHIPSSISNVPFVDFAGFVIVLLNDYLRWWSSDDEQARLVVEAARAERETAFDFLTDQKTIIDDERGIGWGFVPAERCDTRSLDLPLHRHVFPTARAVVGICRYCNSKGADSDRVDRAQGLLIGALDWLQTLIPSSDEGLFFASEARVPALFADHIYSTEALVTLAEASVPGARSLALNGLNRFLNELDKGEATVVALDGAFPHWLAVKEYQGYQFYKSRLTSATCLAVLAQSVAFLVNVGAEEGADKLLPRAREHCTQLVQYLLDKGGYATHEWIDKGFQFHAVLATVEALLRYSRYVPVEKLETTVEKVLLAADLVLKDQVFIETFRKLIVDKIRQLDRTDLRSSDAPEEPGTK